MTSISLYIHKRRWDTYHNIGIIIIILKAMMIMKIIIGLDNILILRIIIKHYIIMNE